MRGRTVPNASIRRSVVGFLVIVAFVVTVWSAVAKAGPIPTPAPIGSVVGWGSDSHGQATPPRAVNGVSGTAKSIAAGDFHSCAIQAGTGNVVCWGHNGNDRATPPDAVNGVSGTATAIAGGGIHNCAIQAGTNIVVCWGWDGDGRATPPDTVNGVLGTATHIAAGRFHALAIVGPPPDCLCAV